MIVGDSLSAEYGIVRGSGWVSLLQQKLKEHAPQYRVANASISGDTTSGGVSRTPGLIEKHQPAIFILELGANDALRGLPLDVAEKNLNRMAQAAREANAKILVIGMQIPPNFGRRYAEEFKTMFEKVAKSNDAALVPFFFEGIALQEQYFQADGIHPNESAQQALFDNVWPTLQPLL